jgi:HD-like signal output (HDOD) protein
MSTRIIENLEDFPTLPTIYTQLMEIMGSSRSTIENVAAVIERDQASSIKILRTVNSSVYGLNKKVDSIREAIFYLGFQEVKNLVFSLTMINLFKNKKKLSFFNLVDYWKHSIAVGVITRLIGKVIGEKKLDNYFISGIIHDIGKLYFVYYKAADYQIVVENTINNDKLIINTERDLIGMDHCQAGWEIAKKWQLPDSLAYSILYHYDGTINGKSNKLVASVHLADIIARAMQLGNPGDILVQRPNPEIWEILKITDKDILQLENPIMEQYNDSISILLVNK